MSTSTLAPDTGRLPQVVPSKPRTRDHVAGLDGLRALAVVAVLLYHLSPGWLPGGYIGVDLFFVISGFIITTLLLRERERTRRVHLGEFWLRRARRLLPAVVLVVLVCGAAAFAIGGDVVVQLGWQVLGALTFSYNWVAVGAGTSYFASTTPELFRNLWSLAVEEQFYLVWPIALGVLLLVRSRAVRIAVLAAVAVLSALAMALLFVPGSDPTRVYYGTDTHSFGLALGAMLAFVWRLYPERPAWSLRARFWMCAAALAALGGLVALGLWMPEDGTLTYRGGLPLAALLSATVIAGAIVPAGWLGRALDLAPLRWVGVRSFGLYLWHWPVFVLFSAAEPDWTRSPSDRCMLGGVSFAITLVAAVLSYRFVETPIRRLGFRASLARFRSWAIGSPTRLVAGTTAIVVALTATALTAGAIAADPGQSQAEQQIERGIRAIEHSPSPTPRPAGATGTAGASVPAPPPSAPPLPGGDEITAIGDSVMLAVAPYLQQAFPGIAIDAAVSRQMSAAPTLIQAQLDAGTLRPIVILGLGTNGPFARSLLDRIVSMIVDRELVLVTNQAPRPWTSGNNAMLIQEAQQFRQVELANWQAAVAPHLDVLAHDQIHAGGPQGGAIYVDAVTGALQRLAELPPLRSVHEYGLAPRPS